ncbi:MAG: DHH family phosphoesterase [Patescibacteria group bacterium]|nr:DHH family phosphoesterase [Patescibacteria group bacterium]MCL5431816.1 DHH family phosphoesterase [Patescibacteria group bacterium]
MSDKVKQLAPVIWEEIKKAQKILMTLHYNHDGDSLGSNLAVYHILRQLGKDVTLIRGDSPLTASTKAFPGFENIVNKNITKINLADFDLFLILDCGNIEQVSRLDFNLPKSLKTIVIDHHGSNPNFGKINLVDSSYPACSQLLYDLFQLWSIELNPDVALCLFVGIYTDTLFKYPGTTSQTFTTAASLTKINPNFVQALFVYENTTQTKDLEFLGLALSKVKILFSKKVAFSAVSAANLLSHKIPKENASGGEIAGTLRSIEGTEIGAMLIEKEKDQVNVSLRFYSKDVSKIAVALGGGGHPGAAGATINQPFARAKKTLLNTLTKIYPELGKP